MLLRVKFQKVICHFLPSVALILNSILFYSDLHIEKYQLVFISFLETNTKFAIKVAGNFIICTSFYMLDDRSRVFLKLYLQCSAITEFLCLLEHKISNFPLAPLASLAGMR